MTPWLYTYTVYLAQSEHEMSYYVVTLMLSNNDEFWL